MIVVLKRGSDEAQIGAVMRELTRRGLSGHALVAADKPVIHIVRGNTRRARKLLKLERVQALVPTSGPRVRRHGRRFFPYHFLNWSSAALLLVATLVLLAGQFPPGIGAAAEASPASPSIALPWYLAWPARWLAGLPAWLAPLLLVMIAAVLLALPTLARRLTRSAEES